MNIGKVIDGKKVANEICEMLRSITLDNSLNSYFGMKLAIVTTGNQDASKVYINSKKNKCEELGIHCEILHYDFLDGDAVKDMVEKLFHLSYPPFIIQVPITGCVSISYIYEELKRSMIKYNYTNPDELIMRMDVDGIISPENQMYINNPEYLFGKYPNHLISKHNLPCTPLGIMTLLNAYHFFDITKEYSNTIENIDTIDKKNVVILGRSNLVGKPLERMLMDANATVTVCHSNTANGCIMDYIDRADLIISAMGNTNVLSYDNISFFIERERLGYKTLIDVGINRDSDGKLRGDCDPRLLEYFGQYTPVPGGVGPMTVAMLMCNVVKYYQVPYDKDYAGAIPYFYPRKYTPTHMDIYNHPVFEI